MSKTDAPRMTRLDWLSLLAMALVWGCSFFFVEIALEALPPLTLVWLRVGLGASALWLLAAALGAQAPRGRAIWRALLLLGLFNNALPFVLIVSGQTQIGAGLASILNATTPVFTVIVAGLALPDERLTPARLLGVLAGLIGAAIIIGPGALAGSDQVGSDPAGWLSVLGQVAILGAAVSYAFASIQAKRMGRFGLSPLILAAGQLTMSTLLLTPLALMVDQPWDLAIEAAGALGQEDGAARAVWIGAIGAMLGLGLLSTALPYILYFRVVRSAGASNVVLVTFLVPPVAILLGAAFLDERLERADLIGMALIGLGLSMIDGRLWGWARIAPRRDAAPSAAKEADGA